jgi:phage gp36-like protein
MADAPTPYATRADVLARYEKEVVDRICWDHDQELASLDKLDAGLVDASTEIDSYLSARYAVPVNPAPAILRSINVDLGLYYTALTSEKLFSELSVRVENWRKHLKMIAEGKVGLGVRVDQEPDPSSGGPTLPEGTGTQTGLFVTAVRV